MDMSDEKATFNDTSCAFQSASRECDDRVCPPNQWSCGDGQCVVDRSVMWATSPRLTLCINRRDQFYRCEQVDDESLWTQADGRCSTKVPKATNSSSYCAYLRRCSCQINGSACSQLYRNLCPASGMTLLTDGLLIKPYALQYYNVTYDPFAIALINVMNGTIKCRGYLAHFTQYFPPHLFGTPYAYAESTLCGLTPRTTIDGYQASCHNDSRTFCNRSSLCISATRIRDGFLNCEDGEDEQLQDRTACATVQRHRFRCSNEEETCLVVSALADATERCLETTEPSSRGIQAIMLTTQCTSQAKTDCPLLRRLIAASWNHSLYYSSDLQSSQLKKIPFRSFCDTFQDSMSNVDENIRMCQASWICLPGEWQCYTGQCIQQEWVLDREWDCYDGSDEENIFAVGFNASHRNYKWLNNSSFVERFKAIYGQILFGKTCNATLRYQCPSRKRRASADRGNDCVSDYDRDYVFDYCLRTLRAVGYDMECASNKFTYRPRCMNRQNGSHDDIVCWDGTHDAKQRCNGIYECGNGEDEFMCSQEKFWQASYRRYKPDKVRKQRKQLRLPRVPRIPTSNGSDDRNMSTSVTTPRPLQTTTALPSRLATLFNTCNRGIPVWTHNRSSVCFCPPQYFGHQCQYHADRIALYSHVNYTHSSYGTFTDQAIVHKFLVLFLADKQVMSNDEFHVRPATEFYVYRKKTHFFYYSRSAHYLQKKRDRYRNRSDIIAVHPFSIRIEAYEMSPNASSRRFAVWHYPIYFDYLPVYRLAKVLRFVERRLEKDDDPCAQSPCSPNEECYRLQNRRSQHLCLCRSGFFGENCSQIDPKCNRGYCSPGAVCQSGYRGLVTGNHWPYCICPLGYIGLRCEISPNRCLEKPCRNGGTCYQRSKPNEFYCECTSNYTGTLCTEPKPFVQLQIEHNTSLEYRASVVKYLTIDLITLELKVIGQEVFTRLFENLTFLHSNPTAPEIVLLTLYSADHADVYLISLRMGEKSISAHTSIGDHNRCRATGNGSQVIEYHSICRSHPDVLCFVDNTYVCICEEDHSRVECFNHDDSTDKCHRCEAKGRCLKGRNDDDIVCLCPPCHEGRRCQFNLESFSFTLDQLFFSDLLSRDRLARRVTYYSLLIAPVILFLLGVVNNVCCFVTFRRPRCLRNGTGHYLYAMSICNQLNLTFLVVRLIHLTLNIASPYSSPTLDGVLCRTSSYLLTTSTRMTYWLSSLIGIERVYVALFVNGQWLKKPHIARRIIALAVVTILTVNAYQLVFIRSQISSDDGLNSMCTITFPTASTLWSSLHSTVTIIDSVAPFCINLLCTVGIICLVTKKKMNATRRDTSELFRKEHVVILTFCS